LTSYDVILIHPPAIFDFRKKTIFPGPLGASAEAVQYTKVPIGMLSLAEYLDRHGYKVMIDNLGDRMVSDRSFNAEQHLKNMSARIFAIGLHFQQHAPGAMEVARLCKKYHPDSLVVLGGLTATCFHEEIIRKYRFVDAVIRGEAERAFLGFIRGLEKFSKISQTPNLTYRNNKGEITVAPLMPPSINLDEFDYTRFDLLEPKTSIFAPDLMPRWSLGVCRGCVYNCAICGGSAYTCKTYLGMDKPAFRSPAKIVEDMQKLSIQGVRSVGLYQDPRMGGEKYWRELLQTLRREKPYIERLSLDLLIPSGEEFIKAVAEVGIPVTIHICPDTGCDAVRKNLGRHYATADLLNTVRLCHKYLIPVTSFFSVGLAGETRENMNETLELWDKLSALEQIEQTKGRFWGIGTGVPLGGPIAGPVLLDPGSPAFDFPEKYGYKLLYRNLEEYIQGLSGPSWHQWINYETGLLKKETLIELILESTAFAIDQREAYGFQNRSQSEAERLKLKADIIAVNEVERIARLMDKKEIESRLKALKASYDSFLNCKPNN
jgi:B12-binding domain/radical SAM domain protein